MEETSINTRKQPTESSRPKRVRAVPGRFGAYGGRYVPETLIAALQELGSCLCQGAKGPVVPR